MDKNSLINKNTANNGEPAVGKTFFPDVSLKELMAMPDVQEAVRRHISVPNPVIPKKVRNPFKNGETGITTQKVESVSGTSLMDIVNVSFTLVGTETTPRTQTTSPSASLTMPLRLTRTWLAGNSTATQRKASNCL